MYHINFICYTAGNSNALLHEMVMLSYFYNSINGCLRSGVYGRIVEKEARAEKTGLCLEEKTPHQIIEESI